MENNNKESFKLLARTGSGSDSHSEVPEFIRTPKKKRLKRRVKANHVVIRSQQAHTPCSCSGVTISLTLAAILLTCWLFTLSWLAVVLHGELQRLDDMVRRVVAGSEGVPDALQKIHSLSRDLQQNQSQLFVRDYTLTLQLLNVSQKLAALQTDVRANTERLQSDTQPFNGKELVATVAQWGSQIKDLDNTVRSLKQQGTALDSLTQTLTKNVTAMEASINQLKNISLRPAPVEPNVAHSLDSLHQYLLQTAANLTETNSTLTKRLQWLHDDQNKDHKVIEGLQEMGQSITARVKTLEGECAKSEAQNALNSTITRLLEQVDQDALRLKAVELTVSQLQTSSETDQLASPGPGKESAGSPSDTISLVEDVQGSSPSSVDTVEKATPVVGGANVKSLYEVD